MRTPHLVTVENKTSFYRFGREDCSEIYLGGFANRHQVALLKRIYADNPGCCFWHFGDIDVGDFRFTSICVRLLGLGFGCSVWGCGSCGMRGSGGRG